MPITLYLPWFKSGIKCVSSLPVLLELGMEDLSVAFELKIVCAMRYALQKFLSKKMLVPCTLKI